MSTSTRRVICILAAPATLAAIVSLEFAMYRLGSAYGHGEEPPFTFLNTVQVLFHVSAAALLVAFGWVVLDRPPGVAVSVFHIIFGLYFTVARLFAWSRLSSVFYALPFSYAIIGSYDVGQLVPPFIMVIGIAGFIRSYAATRYA